MRVLVQRSKKSSVVVEGKTIGAIDKGLVILVGFTEGDTIDNIKYLVNDFKKRGGYKRSTELSAEMGLYRQNFCGCIYSKQERENKE